MMDPLTGQNRGFGFVTFVTKAAAVACVKKVRLLHFYWDLVSEFEVYLAKTGIKQCWFLKLVIICSMYIRLQLLFAFVFTVCCDKSQISHNFDSWTIMKSDQRDFWAYVCRNPIAGCLLVLYQKQRLKMKFSMNLIILQVRRILFRCAC